MPKQKPRHKRNTTPRYPRQSMEDLHYWRAPVPHAVRTDGRQLDLDFGTPTQEPNAIRETDQDRGS